MLVYLSSPRKNRRGIGLLDATLGLIIFSMMLSIGMDFLGDKIERDGHRQEARHLAVVNTALLTLLKTDPDGWRKRVGSSSKGAVQIGLANLIGAGISVPGNVFYGVNGRLIDMWMVASTTNELIYFSRASGEIKSHHYPEPNILHGAIGSVTSAKPKKVQGAGVDWDITTLHAKIDLPIVDDVVAVGYFNLTASHVPYLSRNGAVTSKGINLSQMTVDLNLGGNSILGAKNITATGSLNVNNLAAQNVSVAGGLTAQTAQVLGNANIGGNLEAVSVSTVNKITAGEAKINGGISAGSVNVLGTAKFDTLSVTKLLEVGEKVIAKTASFDTLKAKKVTASEMITIGTGFFGKLTTKECKGC